MLTQLKDYIFASEAPFRPFVFFLFLIMIFSAVSLGLMVWSTQKEEKKKEP